MSAARTFSGLLEAFFTDRLIRQRQASPHTLASYRDTFCLLLAYAQRQMHKAPTDITLADLDTAFLGAFLDHLEVERENSARSRNVRLAAIHSFFRYVALHSPEHSALAQRVLAMPSKRYVRRPVTFLNDAEVTALLAAPDLSRWSGRRDRALLLLAAQTGLRAAELVGLRCEDMVLGPAAYVRCLGKGRKLRNTPLRKVNKHLAIACCQCPSLANKRVTPHVLRHTLAMDLLHHGVDRSVIALWLGHESVETTAAYLQADMQLKEQALAKTDVADVRARRYKPDDQLLAFLKSL
jgi:integrase/recombinase XerD